MAEIVNLNRFRKTRQRQEDREKAAENRVRFGRNKSEKAADQQDRERLDRDHLGKELTGTKTPPDEPA